MSGQPSAPSGSGGRGGGGGSGRGGGGGRRGGRGGGGSGRRRGGKPKKEQTSASEPGATGGRPVATASTGGPAPTTGGPSPPAGTDPKPKKKRQKTNKRGGGGKRGGKQQADDSKQQKKELTAEEVEAKRQAEAEAIAAAQKAAAEAAEAERLRLAAEARQARIDALQSALKAREDGIKENIVTLEAFAASVQAHAASRSRLHPETSLPTIRKDFVSQKKTLKSDLKKCTAFVKKIRSTTVWDDPSSPTCTNPTSTPVATLCKDVTTLNLSRYVDEIVVAIMEVLATPKTKLVDVPGISMVCAAMHERYADFCPALVAAMVAVIRSSTAGGDGVGSGGPKKDGAAGSPKHRRVCMRLLTEFVLLGMVQGQDVKPMVKAISEASGAPPSSEVAAAIEDATDDSGEANVDQEALQATLYPKYNVQDANMVVGFAKAAALEVAGYVPKTVRETMDALQKEINESMAAESRLQAKQQQNGADVATGGQDDAKDAADAADSDIDEDQYSVVSASLMQKAVNALETARATSTSFSTADCQSIAVPPHPSMLIRTHLRATHYQLSTTLVATHTRLLKLEKRCEADRLLQGQLSESREKNLADAQKLVENLTKWVDGLAEALDLGVPTLAKEEDDEDLDAGTRGIELLGKDTEEGDDLGPYDDPETKSFYTDIPDLLTTLPATLLGMSQEEVERKKADNKRKYGGNGEAEDTEIDADADAVAAPDVDESAADAFEEADESGAAGAKDDDEPNKDGDEGETKDTPHYKLQVLLEEELPECHNRSQVDAIAEKFCSNHATSKSARKRLSRTLFLVPRVRLDLLPYYSRLAAIMDRVFSDVSAPLVKELEAQFHGQARWKKNQHLESRLKTARFLGELTKFQVAPPIVVMRALRRCLDDFSGFNIDVACSLLESCGRYLYKSSHTRARMASLLDTMMRIKKAKNLDERAISLINSAMYLVNPPQTTVRKDVKVLSPMEAYLKELFMVRLSPEADSVKMVSKQVQRLPWSDPTQECGYLVVKYMLKACRKGRYKAIGAVTAVAANLKRVKLEVPTRLADTVLEELQWALDHPSLRDQQRTIVYARILGEMLHSGLLPTSLLFEELYKFINVGHEIPPALRESSEKCVTEAEADGAAASASSSSTPMPKFMAAGGDVSQAIAEDEEMEEDKDEGDGNDEDQHIEEPPRPAVVAVSKYSIYDPRVPTPLDPPNSPFRISLVCTVLETSSSVLVTSTNKAKLEAFLAAFQRYLFTKATLPTEVEFNLLDVFDVLDSHWKEEKPGSSRRRSRQESAVGFTRYSTWLEAHNATVAIEEAQALSKERTEARLLAQAGVVPAGDASLAGTAELDELDDEMAIVSDDEGDDLSIDDDDDRSLNSADEISLGSDGSGSSRSSSSDTEEDDDDGSRPSDDDSTDDEESFGDEEDEGDDEEIDAAAAEEAHMRQMEDDAFERELRRLTMDALEKGKVTSRSTGGKVSDNMPVASQLIIKKPAGSSPSPVPGVHGHGHDGSTDAGSLSAAAPLALAGPQAMSFQLLKKGHKGKAETKELFIPTDTNLARTANKQDDEAARERDLLKEQVLRYAAESAEQDAAGGNVYMEQTKLQKIRNRPLTNEAIDNAFGSSNRRRQQGQDHHGAGRGGSTSSGRATFYSGRGRGGGRGPGAGRLFNPGSYGRSTKDDDDF